MKPRVNIIICTYNNKDVIDRVLKSVESQTYRNSDCTIIDDNSSDEISRHVKVFFPWANVIRKTKNTGPSESRNLGINITRGKYIATLDSDVELEKNWLREMVRIMESDNKIGIGASKLVYAKDKKKINSAGGTLTKAGIGKDIGKGKSSRGFAKRTNVLYACSAAMIIRREMLKKIGAFDSKYFYGHEDTDLGWRANIAGWKVVYNPKAVAWHDVSLTISKEPKMVAFNGVKNRIRSMLKNYGGWNAVKYGSLYGILLAGDMILHRNRVAKMKAIFWNIGNINDTIGERKKVQRMRKKSDEELLGMFDDKLY